MKVQLVTDPLALPLRATADEESVMEDAPLSGCTVIDWSLSVPADASKRDPARTD